MQFYSTAQKNVTSTNLISFLERQVSHPRDEHLVSKDKSLILRESVLHGGRSRPSDKGGGAIWPSRLWDKEGGRCQKYFFWPFGPHFGLKIRGGRPPRHLAWICHCCSNSGINYKKGPTSLWLGHVVQIKKETIHLTGGLKLETSGRS